ncbi:retropepsin-like aspartic protease family protein [Phaeovulum vinaykumarii]|uniref:Aspartyl protease family protein n=1 Tax=Phaeovulum vinaykumarii TaxID=407234 RepID=A0A1N7K497_9RHOB|nr:TIGR02281 family clan AA aspartic protease [Phaeovulum vinaykumarii]SIS56422.1 aspartyl protease family protein [Phaeovulum vinaykumarii]SOB92861.1 aspartyl protease family protein [Phaeovulum vinaykumarii]
MTSDMLGQLGYLTLLFLMIGGYVLIELRARPGKALRQAMAWALIFVGVVAAVGLWGDIRRASLPETATILSDGERLEVPKGRDGHFHLRAGVNGVPVSFVVDTGASDIVLTQRDAERAGIALGDLAFFGQARTANGVVSTAPVRLDTLALGQLQLRDVRAVVNGGEMRQSLLGMSLLSRFQSVEMRPDRLILTP